MWRDMLDSWVTWTCERGSGWVCVWMCVCVCVCVCMHVSRVFVCVGAGVCVDVATFDRISKWNACTWHYPWQMGWSSMKLLSKDTPWVCDELMLFPPFLLLSCFVLVDAFLSCWTSCASVFIKGFTGAVIHKNMCPFQERCGTACLWRCAELSVLVKQVHAAFPCWLPGVGTLKGTPREAVS